MTSTIRFIGDVHGKYDRYKKIIQDAPGSIQLGDLGVGFRRIGGPQAGDFYSNPPHYAMVRGNFDVRRDAAIRLQLGEIRTRHRPHKSVETADARKSAPAVLFASAVTQHPRSDRDREQCGR